VVEDLYGIFIGCVLIALGLYLLRMAGLITGGVAGIALMVSYFVPLSAGQLFAIINLPIFLAFWRMLGTAYILRTVVATIAIMALVQVVAGQMMIAAIARRWPRWWAAPSPAWACWPSPAMPQAWAAAR
jgi:uncharacterized membrane-anchored protein YitT (DUF2179 family)